MRRNQISSSCLALLLHVIGYGSESFPAVEKNDEELMKRNAAEQAAALNQDPGGGDRNRLLHQRSMAKILAGVPGERNPHPDAQWFGNASLGLFLHWSISSVHGGIDLSWPMIRNMGPNQ